jgi:hypothetical protein
VKVPAFKKTQTALMRLLSMLVPAGQLISLNRVLMVLLELGEVQAHLPPWHQALPSWTASSPGVPASAVSRSKASSFLPLRSSGAGRTLPNQLPSAGAVTCRPWLPSVWKAADCSRLPPAPGLDRVKSSVPVSKENRVWVRPSRRGRHRC